MPDRLFGIIGKSLKHTFSPKYFSEKFRRESITDCDYRIFELNDVVEVKKLFDDNTLRGVNVTIPFKEDVIPYLDRLDISAEKVGAVNVIRNDKGRLTGFNSDYYGFRESLLSWIPESLLTRKALILGTGGASKAVAAVLKDEGVVFSMVSRDNKKGDLTYSDLKSEGLFDYRLVINTTPLGMYPDVDSMPDLSYESIQEGSYFYDLIYNPSETAFLGEAKKYGAEIKNGDEMLVLQAEKSWDVWNS